MIKILNVLTGGLLYDGITSSWISFLEAFIRNSLFGEIQMDFVAQGELTEEEQIRRIESFGCKVYRLPDRKKKAITYFNQLRKLLKAQRYDIIHYNGSSAIMAIEAIAGACAGVKVRIAHSRNTTCDNMVFHNLLKPLFYHYTTDYFACGKDAGEFLSPNRDYFVLKNGKDFSTFRYNPELREAQRQKLGLDDKLVIGHVGVFNQQKNHSFLIDIFKEIKKKHESAVLYLMGDGPLKNETLKKVEELGLSDSVVFAGRVNDIDKRLQAMDMMIFPSLFEGLPNVVLEWQAMGLPCLISDAITQECAPSDLVEFCSLKENPSTWAKDAFCLYERNCGRTKNSSAAIEALKNAGFDIDENAKALVEKYNELVKR